MIACTKIEFFFNDCYDFLFIFLVRLGFDIPYLFSSHTIGFDEGRRFIFSISFSLSLHIAFLLSDIYFS